MDDPIDKLRKLFETRQAMNGLKLFAEKSETDRLERDWKDFMEKAVSPAFARVQREVFGEKFEPLTERSDPGFKVKDGPNSEFWFWNEFQGRSPDAQARRKFGKSLVLTKVFTTLLSSKRNFELTEVTEADVLGAICFAYEKSNPEH